MKPKNKDKNKKMSRDIRGYLLKGRQIPKLKARRVTTAATKPSEKIKWSS